jgi:hypothetical protein
MLPELPKPIGIALILIFSPLYAIALLQWIVSTIYYREQWACLTFRTNYPPSIKQQFLFFSVWSLWLSIAIFIGWTRKFFGKRNESSSMLENICKVALPHIITVFVTYIYYDISNPANEFVNKEACYTLRKAALSKEITTNEALIKTVLIFEVMDNLTVHYFSAPLMFILLWCGEISYNVVKIWKAFSTLFIIILGVVVGLAQEFGSPIYNGDIWFFVGTSIAINFVVHCMLFGANYICNKRRSKQMEEDSVGVGNEAEGEIREEVNGETSEQAENKKDGCEDEV